MELRPYVYQFRSDILRVKFPTPMSDSVLDITLFELGASSPNPLVYEPSIMSVRFLDTDRVSVELELDSSMTFGAPGGYSLNIGGVSDFWGNYYPPSSHNFESVVKEEVIALGCWFYEPGILVVKFNRPVADISGASAVVKNEITTSSPVTIQPGSDAFNLKLLCDSSFPSGNTFSIEFSGIYTASFNLVEGSVSVTNTLASPLPLDYNSITQYQVISAKIIDIFPQFGYAAIRMYFNGPALDSSALSLTNYVFTQIGVHMADDLGSVFPIPVIMDEASLVSALLTFGEKFNGHLSEEGVHYASSGLVDLSFNSSSDLLFKMWTAFNAHVSNELSHSAQDPVTIIRTPLYSTTLSTNINNALELFSQFNSHIYRDFTLIPKSCLTSSGDGFVETKFVADSYSSDLSPYHYFVDVYYGLTSFKANISYEISVTNYNGSSTTSPLDYSGSGQISTSPSVSYTSDGGSATLYVNPPSVSRGAPRTVDDAVFINSMMRNYNLHLTEHHKVQDVINLFTPSDLAGGEISGILSSSDRFIEVLRAHSSSLEYHYSVTTISTVDPSSLDRVFAGIISNFGLHVTLEPHHKFVFKGILPFRYSSSRVHLVDPSPEGSSTDITLDVDLNYRIGESNDFQERHYSLPATIDSKYIPSVVCGVWFQDGLKWNSSGQYLGRDLMSIYFTKPMNTSNLDSLVIGSTPSFTVTDTFWDGDSVLNCVVPDLTGVVYTVGFTNLTDLAGNVVS